jgi:serine/threonine protein kinase
MAQDASETVIRRVGNYDLIEKVAEGGMGTVYKGRHRDTGEIVAVKVVSPHMSGNPVLLKRFEQEYRVAQQLNHPNIVRALDFGTSGSTPFLVMEFVDGESLGQKLEREGKLPEKEAIRLIAQVAQGLHRAHKEKLIHRDVKPDNILISKDGQAKLVDLGLVKELETDLNLTRTGRGLGTPHFMAPEQFKNAKDAGPKCDIYSLGATLYMMVTGEMPFRSTGPLDAYMKKIEDKLTPARELVPALSERTDWAIRRAMSAEPDNRPATCREFVEDLTGRSTRKMPAPSGGATTGQEVWYLSYQDDAGETQTVKGTLGAIRRSLKDGLLGDASNIRASRTKESGYEPLREYPEFRDLVVMPSGVKAAPANSSRARVTPTRAARERKPEPSGDEPTEPAHPVVVRRPRAPHIDLGTSQTELRAPWPVWLQVLTLLLVVAGSAAVGWFFLFRH